MTEKIRVEKKLLSENNRRAGVIRRKLAEHKILCLNFVSSPGSGKTSLLEKTLASLGGRISMALIAGDVQTDNDARRLSRAGGPIVHAVTTGGACHLDAAMIGTVLDKLDPATIDLLIIENVGNLVCPAGFDLGEDMKVVLISTAEGDDKPLKYPAMFRRASVMVINKIDLLGLSDFETDRARENALLINRGLTIFDISCRTGAGLENWYAWLEEQIKLKKSSRP